MIRRVVKASRGTNTNVLARVHSVGAGGGTVSPPTTIDAVGCAVGAPLLVNAASPIRPQRTATSPARTARVRATHHLMAPTSERRARALHSDV